MEYRWTRPTPPDEHRITKLQEKLGISRPLCQLLVQRGIYTYEQAYHFFRPQLDQLHDPFQLRDMDRALDRIEQARSQGESIMIYGDYDVDGTTSVAMMYSFLSAHYPHSLENYIPDRYREGYGISQAGIDRAAEQGITLIIALDCGIKAHKQVAYARDLGIDFIICDHHLPGPKLPPAVAVLDPARPDCPYPFAGLSGCGVGFKLIQALCQRWKLPDNTWKALLDLLAVSIGADIVPITGENRILAHYGLRLINERPRLALRWLRQRAGQEAKVMNIRDVVFTLGPRINAAGRIDHGKSAVQLLTARDEKEVERLSAQINDHNTERQKLDKEITGKAQDQIIEAREEEGYTTVVYDPQWHKGVIGIVASRLIEKYYRPTVVFTGSGEVLAGSARSVEGFDLYKALEACQQHLIQFGGHKAAAGMSMRRDALPAFKACFEEVVRQQILPEQRRPHLDLDLVVSLSDLSPQFFKILAQFAPFGPGNLAPVLVTHDLVDAGSKAVGADMSHLRTVLRDPQSGMQLTGIGFRMAEYLSLLQSNEPLSVSYHLEENEFRGEVSLQMRLLDLKSSRQAREELKQAEPGSAHQEPAEAS